MEDKDTRQTKKPNLRIILFIPIAIIAIAVFVMIQNKNPSEINLSTPSTKEGPVAPNFTLKDLNGRTDSLSDHKGKVVLVNIWATWCPPCVAETPSIDKLYKMLKDDNFVLMAISIDENGKKAVESFMKKKNLSFPVLLDPDGRIASLYGTTGVPESFIVGKDGIIDNHIIGAIDWTSPKVIEHLHELMKE